MPSSVPVQTDTATTESVTVSVVRAADRIEGRLKLRQFALAIAIHDHGSLHKAAEALNITQPAATSALKELETTFGTTLFDRSRAGMEPTMFGRLLVERARIILGNIRSTALEIQELQGGASGEVRVGTLPSSALGIIPQAIVLCRQRRPGVQLHFSEGSIGQLLPALKRGDLDLVVGRMPLIQTEGDFDYEVLAAEPNVVVCRAAHPLSRRQHLTLRDLADQEWILPEEGAHFRSQWHEAFIEAGIEPPAAKLVTSSITIRVALLAMTDMICVLTRRAALSMQEQGQIAILDVAIYREVPPSIIVWRTGAMLTPAARAFCTFLHEATKSTERADARP